MPSAVKILHTSDVHLDSRYTGIADIALRARRRKDHADIVRRTLDVGRDEEMDLALITGDLFDESTFRFQTAEYLIEEFRRIRPTPIFICPGLADPYHERSPYRILDWGENVHIFPPGEYSSVSLPDLGVTVHGMGADPDRPDQNPLRGLRGVGDGTIEIAMVYGSNLDRVPEGAESPFPFREEDASATGVHYLALGGYRSFAKFGKRPVGCYPGMPEGTDFRGYGEKVVVMASVDRKKVSLRRRSVAGVTFQDCAVDLADISSMDEVIRRVEKALQGQDRADTVLRLRMTGRVDPAIVLDPEDLGERIHTEHAILQIVDETRPIPDWHEYRGKKTVAGEFTGWMEKKIQVKGPGRFERIRDYGLAALVGKEELRLGKPPTP